MFVINNVHSTIGGHDLDGDDIVDGHPVKTTQETDSATERKSTNTNAAGIAEPDRKPVRRQRPGDLSHSKSGTNPSRPIRNINVDVVERTQVEEQSVAGAVGCTMVRPAPHEEGQPGKPSCVDRRRYVIDMLGAYDGERVGDPDRKVCGARVVVIGACGKHLTVDAQAQSIDKLVAISNDVHGHSLRRVYAYIEAIVYIGSLYRI